MYAPVYVCICILVVCVCLCCLLPHHFAAFFLAEEGMVNVRDDVNACIL